MWAYLSIDPSINADARYEQTLILAKATNKAPQERVENQSLFPFSCFTEFAVQLNGKPTSVTHTTPPEINVKLQGYLEFMPQRFDKIY